jgi:hypothetical protein
VLVLVLGLVLVLVLGYLAWERQLCQRWRLPTLLKCGCKGSVLQI